MTLKEQKAIEVIKSMPDFIGDKYTDEELLIEGCEIIELFTRMWDAAIEAAADSARVNKDPFPIEGCCVCQVNEQSILELKTKEA